ncbi:hypothetical protein PVAND_015248 [Polypedilum vanderplanki]|uniref:C-type lectin domain-containing protein n=1 Tax=Polypedilum vanderplanki TaxID=319348 RepID=A0A9J6BBR1_POLVA|nr:hypothetical protein PVAND_015248 [Polypedilum vanderplanki]
MKLITSFLLITVAFEAALAQSNDTCDIYKYPCANRFIHYNLDNEPADYGVVVGEYEPGKEAYVGLASWLDNAYTITQLQLHPPGVWSIGTGESVFLSNDTSRIWYLFHDLNHKYTWVDSQDGEIPPFAIVVGEDRVGFPILPGRIIRPNGLVYTGTISPIQSIFGYIDENYKRKTTTSKYQVLTCKSSIQNETKIMTPLLPNTKPNVDTGCINNWQPYKNDDAPTKNGISAGEHDCNNTAFVGKAKPTILYYPGRIQVTPNAGFYTTEKFKNVYMTNGSYYLVDNPNYTYKWIEYDGENNPDNTVYVRSDIGTIAIPVVRSKIDGKTEIGRSSYPTGIFSNEKKGEEYFSNYELLVCDPVPKYQCAQDWKIFNVNDTKAVEKDGFNAGVFNDSIPVYIGRSCDFGIGRIQISPQSAAGLYYIDDRKNEVLFDNSNETEYLVQNPSYTYKWVPSRSGVKVVNALELHKEGHRPFYIGMTRINDNVVVGKVRPGDGLFFIDPVTGKQRSVNSYNVLTCTSPEPKNGVYVEESDDDWYGDFWCPDKKVWNFEESKCVCKQKFRDLEYSGIGKWNNETCSYIIG